jgi:hypothetical protein
MSARAHTLAHAGLGPNQRAIHESPPSDRQKHLNAILLNPTMNPNIFVKDRAHELEFLFQEGAFVEPHESELFLNCIFDPKLPRDALEVCKRHYKFLIANGLDVNYRNDQGWNILNSNMLRHHNIRKALEWGADPFLKDDAGNDPIEGMQRELHMIPNGPLKDLALDNMALVKAAQAHALNRLLPRAPLMQRLPIEVRQRIMSHATHMRLQHGPQHT